MDDGLATFALILGVILAAIWGAVPFAIFGLKKRLDEANRHLERLDRALGKDEKPTSRLAQDASDAASLKTPLTQDDIEAAKYSI